MAEPTKRGRGRPPEPVPADIADAVCDWLYAGKTMLSFCEQPGMPARRTIDDWKAKDADFAAKLARARKASADVKAELAQHAVESATPETVQVAKLKADLYMKHAACFDPSSYGQKAQLDHSGGVSIQVLTGVPQPSPEEGSSSDRL